MLNGLRMFSCIASCQLATSCIGCYLRRAPGCAGKTLSAWLLYPAAYSAVGSGARRAHQASILIPLSTSLPLGYGGVFVRAGMLLLVFLGTGLLVLAVGRWTRGRPPA